jgi:hypothetical protein
MKKLLPLVLLFASMGCVPMVDMDSAKAHDEKMKWVENGVEMKRTHDDFKNMTTYYSKAFQVEFTNDSFMPKTQAVSGNIIRVVKDDDKSFREYLKLNFVGGDWCFISDGDELNFLAGENRLSLTGDGESTRDVISGDMILEQETYKLTKKNMIYFVLVMGHEVRIQINASRCKMEGYILKENVNSIAEFIGAFEGN